MSKQWVRQQVRKDEMADALGTGVEWVSRNRQLATTVAGVAVAVVLMAALFVIKTRAAREVSWERLGVAQSLAYSGRPDQSLEQLKKLQNEQPNTDAAGFAALFQGDLEYQRGNFKNAAAQYTKVVERGTPKALQPLALSDLAMTQEAAQQYKDAVSTSRRFLESFPDHFLAPQVHSCLARSLQGAGDSGEAKAALQKIALQYPDTSWAAWAQARLKGS